MRALLLVAALLAGGCRRREASHALPDALVAVVRLGRGGYASTLVRLERPGVAPSVEVFPGVLAAGPGFAVGVTLGAQRGDAGIATRIDVELPGDGRRLSAVVDGEVAVEAVEEDGLYLGTQDGPRRLDFQDGVLRVADHGPAPGGAHAAGPGHGFSARHREDRLELRLPHADADAWTPVIQGVEGLVGAWWLSLAAAPAWQVEALEGRFARVGVLSAELGAAVADGDLREWRGARAFAVDLDRQVLDGREYWSGPNDASFGVAARIDRGRILLAIRVRDDAVDPVHDRLEVRLADRLLILPVPGPSRRLEGPDWHAAFTAQDGREFGVELQLEAGSLRPDRFALPLTVHYLDADPGEGASRLATAASPSLVGAGFRAVEPAPGD